MSGNEIVTAAIEADEAWDRALKAAGHHDRWSPGAAGTEGSRLRELFNTKLAADRELANLFGCAAA